MTVITLFEMNTHLCRGNQ